MSDRNQPKLFRRSRAFTLVELLVVVMLLGILVAVALPNYRSSTQLAKENAANANARQIAAAVQSIYVRNGGDNYRVREIPTRLIRLELGGAIPINPCTGGRNLRRDYGFRRQGEMAVLQPAVGRGCDAAKLRLIQLGQVPVEDDDD
ncbi:MAG: prepilin-type N-terminal cleavage/methylation domain-containing protein [Fimbriimonadaceae bacterium]|nr:prepilin-type N-terminal cleavage/methylation domain-containing protein [Fimbriimonadaceae bacterium]